MLGMELKDMENLYEAIQRKSSVLPDIMYTTQDSFIALMKYQGLTEDEAVMYWDLMVLNNEQDS